jgi:hypothetical protein
LNVALTAFPFLPFPVFHDVQEKYCCLIDSRLSMYFSEQAKIKFLAVTFSPEHCFYINI